MQIFSPSHTRSFSSKASCSLAGFTLIELLISAAIIGIVSTIVLVKHTSFDSTVLLKGAAYEIALELREAQVKSVSASGNNNQFNYPYGVTFTPGSKTYTAFRFTSTSTTEWPRYDIAEADPDFAVGVAIGTMGRSMYVSDVCITDSGGENCGITRLDISFRRPEFKAIFYAEGYGSPQNIQSAKIKVASSANGANVFVVEVSSLGQISVSKE